VTAGTTRLAHERDAPAIARIYNDGIADRIATFETEPRSADDIIRVLAQRGDRWPTVVVERDGRVVAWAGASEYRSRECYAGVAEFSVYVAREHRGRGAGRVAMEALIAECERRGMWKLVSRVFPENAPSRALLAGLGFREVGTYRRHAKLDGLWRDTVIVERLIGDAAAMSESPVEGR
jgi:phosphinothricin acetyltransferase